MDPKFKKVFVIYRAEFNAEKTLRSDVPLSTQLSDDCATELLDHSIYRIGTCEVLKIVDAETRQEFDEEAFFPEEFL